MLEASRPVDSHYDKAGSKSRDDRVRPKLLYSLFLLELFHKVADGRKTVPLCELQDELEKWGWHV